MTYKYKYKYSYLFLTLLSTIKSEKFIKPLDN